LLLNGTPAGGAAHVGTGLIVITDKHKTPVVDLDIG
jgi:hypothetical protein